MSQGESIPRAARERASTLTLVTDATGIAAMIAAFRHQMTFLFETRGKKETGGNGAQVSFAVDRILVQGYASSSRVILALTMYAESMTQQRTPRGMQH